MSLKLVTRSVWSNPGNRGRRWRKTLGAVGWQVRKRVWRSGRVLRLANGVRFRAYPDCVISSALIYADWPEFAELMFLRRFLRPGEAVLDVGANVGHISLLLSDVVGPQNLFAFEPTAVTFGRLLENWRLNGWATDQLFPVAIGSRHGSVRVPDVDRPVTTNSVTDAGTDGTVAVPLVPLDDYRPQLGGRRVGLLKVDVEGYEPEAFRGASQILSHDRPRMVMFESLGGRLSDDMDRILGKAGYVPFGLAPGGRPVPHTLSAQNLFAVPAEEAAGVFEAPAHPDREVKGA